MITRTALAALLAVALLVSAAGCGKSSTDNQSSGCLTLPDTGATAEDAKGEPGVDAYSPDLGEPDVMHFDFLLRGDAAAECVETPYAFGCPCQDNGECESGFCVEGTFGGVCTQQCVEECAEGWHCKGLSGMGPDLIFLCVPDTKKLCYPCELDAQCGGGLCISMEDGDFCTYSCDEASKCPATFACGEVEKDGETFSMCLPDSGSCSCTSETSGQVRPCQVENDIGLCLGYEFCDPGNGWVDCNASTPGPEVCDGADNDCDGAYDEELPLSQECEVVVEGVGTCLGQSTCLGALGWVCQAAEPTEELCDYVDNNCNGEVDEDFVNAAGLYNDFAHCGSCTVSCETGFPNATAICDDSNDPPLCVVGQCDPGYFKYNEFQCIPIAAGLCEPCSIPENCIIEGATCVEVGGKLACTKQCDSDADCPDGYSCEPLDGEEVCTPNSGSCSCDGTNLDLIGACAKTWPTEPEPGQPFVTCYGTEQCTPDGWGPCVLPAEVCDNMDNDCDGDVDEDFVNESGNYASVQHCGQCNNNCTFLDYANATSICDADLATPSCSMTCLDGFQDVNQSSADGCECEYIGEPDLPDGADQNCDGVDGEIGNAVFVAKNGADENPGTIDEPMLTIQAALAKAAGEGKRDVYVASGVYAESILLAQGVALYGGYSSDFQQRNIDLNVTVIMGQDFQNDLPGAVNAFTVADAPASTVLDGFTIYGRNNTTPGGSSYAVYIRNSTDALVVTHNTIESGVGGPGLKGSDGVNGAAGADGAAGDGAFGTSQTNCGAIQPALPRPGGLGGAGSCDDGVPVDGGAGGGNTCPPSYNSAPVAYENGAGGQGPLAGSGGIGGYDREVWFCWQFPPDGECRQATGGNEVGNPGMAGGLGGYGETAGGNGCSADAAVGMVVDRLWVGTGGQPGQAGSAGSGGGGGGAGGGAQDGSGCNGQTHIGGAGGGGGAGGCGGTGCDGGGSGGGSFGIFLVWDEAPANVPEISGNVIHGGLGGPGGQGGSGGSGGPGGAGGAGGADDFNNALCAAPGGNGGDGGNGGHGEGGGGGCGGASYCLFAFGNEPGSLDSYQTQNTFVPGAGGPGGSGGPSIGNPGDAGSSGAQASTNF